MKRFAVIGNPIAHSRSPEIHQAFALQAGIELQYEKLLAEMGDFGNVARQFVSEGGNGFNITVPFKQDAYALAMTHGEAASKSQVVNTITVLADGQLKGDNTDGAGLINDLRSLDRDLVGQRWLVLGAGGAVQGVLPDILETSPQCVHLYNRTREKAQKLSTQYEGVDAKLLATLEEQYDIVVSGTSAGLAGKTVSIPKRVVGPATLCYDMIYSRASTPFNVWATRAGCGQTSDGLGMLVEQAALAFREWTGYSPETQPVIAKLRQSL